MNFSKWRQAIASQREHASEVGGYVLPKPRSFAALLLILVVIAAMFVGSNVLVSPAYAEDDPDGCGYATTGPQASTLCWIDMSSYDDAQARSDAGQDMTISLPGGYTISFNVRHTGNASSRTIVARPMDSGPAQARTYLDAPGSPRLYTNGGATGSQDRVTLRNITVEDSAGQPVEGYGFVAMDAEYTDALGGGGAESVRWDSDQPLNILDNSLAGGCPAEPNGIGTNTVTCNGVDGGRTLILQSESPTEFAVSAASATQIERQAFAFAVQTTKLSVSKNVDSRVNGSDAFDVSIVSPEGTEAARASTGAENTASTDKVTVLPRLNGGAYVLGEEAAPGSTTDLSEYRQFWECVNANEGSNTVLPDGDGASVEVSPQVGDDISCTVTNAALVPSLEIEKSANRADLPAIGEQVEYTVTVTNSGDGDYTEEKPASFTDDLTDVLDAALYNDDAVVSAGTVSYEAPTLTWEGPLAAGESATLTYSATYTGEGDQNLRNVACVPADQTVPGAPACDEVEIPGSGLTQWKEVESTDTPAVDGSVLTYTLFFNNTGEATATVDSIDDLTHVTDDADVTAEPTATSGLAAVRTDNRIAITGELAPGELASVTYQVTVRDDGERGDDIAANFLVVNDPEEVPPTPEDPVCEPADEQFPDCTATPIGAVTYEKSVDASDDPVDAGTVLTYTVAVKNTGAATAAVSREDVLTDVLDDADLVSSPSSDTDSVTVSTVTDDRFKIGGEIAAGETAVITYQVKVKPVSERGNNSADNFLVSPGEDPEEECAEASFECTSTPLPSIESTKMSDPESGTTVEAGDDVTYTLTFTNTGEGPGGVDYTDDLSNVVDDATIVSEPASSDSALTAILNADDTIAITGVLDAGQKVTVTYTANVNEEGQRGNNRLGNVLVETGTEPDCDVPGVSCTEHPIPLLDSWKQVEANASPVAEGTVLTYTLYFENTGAAAAVVDEIDDLTHVTDDADVTTEPSSEDGLAADRDGNLIAITGEVQPGETATVTYEVTIKADGERGDDTAANFLMSNTPDGPPTVPEEPVCQAADSERPDCTVTPVGKLTTGKSVSADTDPISAGTVLTYTLTFDNQGEGPASVDYTDILTDVLDDADLTTTPETSGEALIVSEVEDERFSVSGELAPGQVETVTYQVTVKASERGNNTADNFLVPEGEEPPSDCSVDDPNCTTTPLPLVEVDKSADPESGSAVEAGQEVTYTLTFHNAGEAAGEVDYTDDLAAVLDDADLTDGPSANDPSLLAGVSDDGRIRVTGTLAPGQSVKVSYTVTVKPDGDRGDNELRNIVMPTGADGDCGTAGVHCTEHPVGEVDDWKTVDPASGTTVRAGAELTYTLHFENTGKADKEFAREDVLTQVLDDAYVTTQPVASDEALAVSDIADGRFQISGTLVPGQAATVTYKVTVKADGDRGDDRLGNFLVSPGEEPPAECEPTQEERPDCTINHVNDVSVVKSSNPESGTEVEPGQDVTYTLTFENASANGDAAPVEVDYTDYMADVLDDATLVDGPRTSNNDLQAAVDGDVIRITGSVPTGATYMVDYTVKVNDTAGDGNGQLGNVVAITGEDPVCADDSPLCTVHEIPSVPPSPGKYLPATGGSISPAAITAGAVLLLVGGFLLAASRRRKSILSAADHEVGSSNLI